MSKIGIVYSFHTQNTSAIAEMVADKLVKYKVEKVNIEEASSDDFLKYDLLIIGSATWFEGEIPNHWDEFLPSIEELDFTNKKVAFFGLGDQVAFPDYFGDAIGRLADFFESRGAKLIALFPNKDYTFEQSYALRGNKFIGPIFDFDNQADLNEERVDKWTKLIEKEL
jgi:flavodoxin I